MRPVGRGKVRVVGTQLTRRQLKMLDLYYGVCNLNKTAALRQGGYAHPNKSHKIFSFPAVRKEMRRREEATRQKYAVSYERLMDELMRMALSSPLDYMNVGPDGFIEIDLAKASADELRAVGEVVVETYVEGRGATARQVRRVKVKPWPKIEAIDKALRHAGLSRDKLKIEGEVSLVDRITAARRRVKAVGEVA